MIDKNIISRALRESINALMKEETSACSVGADAGVNGEGNGFEYDAPLGNGKKGDNLVRKTFWNTGNFQKTMQRVDDESTEDVNKKKK